MRKHPAAIATPANLEAAAACAMHAPPVIFKIPKVKQNAVHRVTCPGKCPTQNGRGVNCRRGGPAKQGNICTTLTQFNPSGGASPAPTVRIAPQTNLPLGGRLFLTKQASGQFQWLGTTAEHGLPLSLAPFLCGVAQVYETTAVTPRPAWKTQCRLPRRVASVPPIILKRPMVLANPARPPPPRHARVPWSH